MVVTGGGLGQEQWGSTTAEDRLRWWEVTGQNQLRQLFYWRDPIGVNDAFPNDFGDYDRYADGMRDLMLGDLPAGELKAGVLVDR